MYKCKKCGYKSSFKSLMKEHIKTHRTSANGRVVYGYDNDVSESVFLECCDSSSCDFSSSDSSSSDSFSGGGGSFGGGGASGGWDSGSCDSGSCGGD